MRRHGWRCSALIAAGACAALAARAEIRVDYLYRLSDFSGPVLYELPRLAIDRERGEVLVAEAETVRIFGPSGMGVYEFEHDAKAKGALLDIASLPGGEILLLTQPWAPAGVPNPTLLTRCDFRGRPQETHEIGGLPEGWTDFAPDVLRVRSGRRYVASLAGRKVAEVDATGRYLAGWDLGQLIGGEGRRATDLDLGGFEVGRKGEFVVSAPVIGLGFRVSPDSQVESFGSPGSGSGALGIAKGVAVTDEGFVLVADILNQRIVVFDDRLEFITFFPSRRAGPEHLAGPVTLATAPDGRVFVGELGGGSIAVFRLVGSAVTP